MCNVRACPEPFGSGLVLEEEIGGATYLVIKAKQGSKSKEILTNSFYCVILKIVYRG